MSEQYEYEEEEQCMEEEQNIETKIELDYFEVEDLLRNNRVEQAIKDLNNLYDLADQHHVQSWKAKILSQLLQIYCKKRDNNNIKLTLNRMSQYNKIDKYTQNSVKSIIMIIMSLDGEMYSNNRQLVYQFITDLQPTVQLKCYLLFLQKAVSDDKSIIDAQKLFTIINQIFKKIPNPPASSLLQFYSLQIKHSKLAGCDISDKIRMMELKMPTLQNQGYLSQSHISTLKQAIAEIMYLNGNYESSALYLAQVFSEKSKYGTAKVKEILKTNVLMCLLMNNIANHRLPNYNMLYNVASTPFKTMNDVQALFGLVEAFTNKQYEVFAQQFKMIDYLPESCTYDTLYAKIIFQIKKTKLQHIVASYKRIKFSYIGRRLQLDEQSIEKIVFELIMDQFIRGRIHIQTKQKYLQLLPPQNTFLSTQLENLREISKRY